MAIKIIMYYLIFLLITVNLRIEGCDVLEGLICQCYSSPTNETKQLKCTSHYTSINGPIKLTNTSLNSQQTFDSFHLTFHTQQFNITAMFISELSYLFARQERHRTIQIILTFQEYTELNFQDYAFYQIFGERSEQKTSLSIELTSSGILNIASMAFFQLNADRFSLHSSSLEPYSFEELFNNTNIGSLTIEGCTPRSNATLQTHFNGKIQAVKVIKMAELISSEEFPSYPVQSLTIEVHEPRRINASTFTNYQNLYGIHFVRPRFFFDQRSFDGFQYLANLETIELDAESIKDNTFEHVRRIRYLTLGSNVRYLFENSLSHLDYLSRFDLSKILIDQLYPSTKCILARYIEKQHRVNPSMIVVPPQAEFCDCVYDFILSLSKKKADKTYTSLCQSTQQERCQLNECEVVKHYRFIPDENEQASSIIPAFDDNLAEPVVNYYAYDPQEPEKTTTSTTVRSTKRMMINRITTKPTTKIQPRLQYPSTHHNSYFYQESTTTTTTTPTTQPMFHYPSVNDHFGQRPAHHYPNYHHEIIETTTLPPTFQYPSFNNHVVHRPSHNYPHYYHHDRQTTTTTTTTTTRQTIVQYPLDNHDFSSDSYGGSSFAETQVIVLPAVPPPPPQTSSTRSYFPNRKRMRKGKNPTRTHFGQNIPAYSYQGPHW